MEDIEKLVLDKIEEMREDIIKFHQEIVQIPSENPPGKYKEVVKFTEKAFTDLGLKTKVKRNNVVGEIGNQNGQTLILNGHLDTVEAYKGWTQKPFGGEIIDGKIYGRGASDDKSSVTAEIFATKALLETGIKLNGKLILTAVVDEETGGLRGSDYILESGLVDGDACLLGDAPNDYPFGFCGGNIFLTFIIKGKKAHGLANPDLPNPYRSEESGINSVERMVKIMNFLLKLKEEFLLKETKYPLPEGSKVTVSSLNLAEIHGGDSMTTVPERSFLHVTITTIPEQDISSIKNRILEYMEEMKKQDPNLNITLQNPITFDPQIIDINSDFAKAVLKATKAVFDEEREFKLSLGPTDAHWFQERDIPTILIGSSRADNKIHAVDEFVHIEDLINTTKLFAISILNYLK